MPTNAIFSIVADNIVIGTTDSREEARLMANAHNILTGPRGPYARIDIRSD